MKRNIILTNCFNQNEFYYLYCQLIEQNKETKQEIFRTQQHHIIPKCYYKLKHLKLDNSEENLVNLLYSDHILAHYYLCLCVKDNEKQLKYRLQNSFFHLIQGNASTKEKIMHFDLDKLSEYQKIYTNWKILNSEMQKGRTAWNKGLTKENDSRVAKYSVPRHFSTEHNENLRKSLVAYYKNHPGTMKGRHLSDETKLKLSVARKGKSYHSKNPDITRQKISKNSKRYWQEHPEKIDELIHYNKTRTLSLETRAKMLLSQQSRKPVEQINANGDIINTYSSMNAAIKATGVKRWRLENSCKTGKILKEGYLFRFIQK